MLITIDGPSASGKTSAAQLVAQKLGIPYLSSGLLYRAVTLIGLLENIPATELESVLPEHNLKLMLPSNQIWLDGRDISEALHSLEVDSSVSAVAIQPGVRAYVNKVLREVQPPFVIDGRDMGSIVFPEATHKFYLTATPEVRARRRTPERSAAFDTVLAEIIRRDQADALQSAPAKNALILDTTYLNLPGVVATILETLGQNRL
jgi:CMP/dCMP kinase